MDGKHHILVVEDDPDIRACVADALEAEGYEVDTASDGVDALDVLGHSDPEGLSAAVVDVMMPRMSGPEFVREARRSGLLSRTPVITMTAYDVEIEGAAAHLRKPFGLDEVVRTVHDVCSR